MSYNNTTEAKNHTTVDITVLKDKAILLGGQSLGIIALLVLAWVSKNILQPKLSAAKRSLALPVETERTINTLLGRILAESMASRVLLAQFHNGQNYYGGYSYSKLTVTHEALSVGTAALAFNIKEVPLSLYAEDIALINQNLLLKQTRYAFITPDSFKTPVCKQRMLRMGVEGYYCFILRGIVDKEEVDVGAIFLHYTTLDKVRAINKALEELILTVESYIVPNNESTNIWVKMYESIGKLLVGAK